MLCGGGLPPRVEPLLCKHSSLHYRCPFGRRCRCALTYLLTSAIQLSQGSLTYVGDTAFSRLIPFLILFATLLLASARSMGSWVSARTFGANHTRPSLLTRLVEFLFAVYGGFFGAGLGIMLMAGLLILGVHDLQANNALENLLAAIANTVAVLVLAVSGLVSWSLTIVAFIGAMLGGLLGVRVARVLPAVWLRRVVVAIGLVLSVYYFGKYYDLGV